MTKKKKLPKGFRMKPSKWKGKKVKSIGKPISSKGKQRSRALANRVLYD